MKSIINTQIIFILFTFFFSLTNVGAQQDEKLPEDSSPQESDEGQSDSILSKREEMPWQKIIYVFYEARGLNLEQQAIEKRQRGKVNDQQRLKEIVIRADELLEELHAFLDLQDAQFVIKFDRHYYSLSETKDWNEYRVFRLADPDSTERLKRRLIPTPGQIWARAGSLTGLSVLAQEETVRHKDIDAKKLDVEAVLKLDFKQNRAYQVAYGKRHRHRRQLDAEVRYLLYRIARLKNMQMGERRRFFSHILSQVGARVYLNQLKWNIKDNHDFMFGDWGTATEVRYYISFVTFTSDFIQAAMSKERRIKVIATVKNNSDWILEFLVRMGIRVEQNSEALRTVEGTIKLIQDTLGEAGESTELPKLISVQSLRDKLIKIREQNELSDAKERHLNWFMGNLSSYPSEHLFSPNDSIIKAIEIQLESILGE